MSNFIGISSTCTSNTYSTVAVFFRFREFMMVALYHVFSGAFDFLIGHSVPSTITLVVGNFNLKPDGAKCRTSSWDGHILSLRHCLDFNKIHVYTIFLTLSVISTVKKSKSWCVPLDRQCNGTHQTGN